VEIKAALTPEEWKTKSVRRFSRAAGARNFDLEPNGLFVHVGYEETMDDAYHIFFSLSEDHYALAALCLHGQPFGFTREDVEMLRYSAENTRDNYAAQDYLSLADRLEALLPPKDDD
jgi:hypothetical protein